MSTLWLIWSTLEYQTTFCINFWNQNISQIVKYLHELFNLNSCREHRREIWERQKEWKKQKPKKQQMSPYSSSAVSSCTNFNFQLSSYSEDFNLIKDLSNVFSNHFRSQQTSCMETQALLLNLNKGASFKNRRVSYPFLKSTSLRILPLLEKDRQTNCHSHL